MSLLPFIVFNIRLSALLIRKSKLFKQIGVENITNFIHFFQDIDIGHRVSCPHTHQQNGSAERKHHHIVETGLALLAYSSVPL
jgi:hypothetical protein